MDHRTNELEAFKTDASLLEVAASLGYELNAKRSSRGSAVMEHAGGDRIIVAVAPDRHWIYCSVRDPSDAGSVIDFWQRRRGGNLGQVRKALRPFLRGSTPPPLSGRAVQAMPRLQPVERDILAVRAHFEAAEPVAGHHLYLCGQRLIPPPLLAPKRFAECVRTDTRGNALFPHCNDDGLCGYEIKNNGFTGFAAGGVKGLWTSAAQQHDQQLVVAETAIDALSYAALFGHECSRFASIAGQMNPTQPALLKQAMERMPEHALVIAAVDHDQGGQRIAEATRTVYNELGRNDLVFKIHRPPTAGADWNDVLRHAPADQPRPRPA